MHLKLGEVELIRRTDKDGATTEIRSVNNLTVKGRRSLVELHIPGSSGNRFQDQGRGPFDISIEGVLIGADAGDTVRQLAKIFEAGDEVPFSTDIPAVDEISKVVVDEFNVVMTRGAPLEFNYRFTLREVKEEGKEGEAPPPSPKDEAKREVGEKTKEAKAEAEKGGIGL